MKKFTKIALILAAIFGILGIGSLIGAVSMGYAIGDPIQLVEEKILEFSNQKSTENQNPLADDKQPSEENITSEKAESLENVTTISEQIHGIDVEFGVGQVEIFYDDVAQVQVEQHHVSNFKCYVDEGELHVKGGINVGIQDTEEQILIRIPRGMSLAEFDLEVGAGIATVETITAKEVSIEVGAGKADVNGLDAQSVSAEVDAGELNLNLAGKREDYNYELECGVGTLEIGDSSYSGLGKEQTVKHTNATRHMDVECRTGKIKVTFLQ